MAKRYHLPQETFLAKYKQHIVNEIRYLALAITDEQNVSTKQISRIWLIQALSLIPREKMTIEQAGSLSKNSKLYYLFELGKPLTLKDPIDNVPLRSFRQAMKLTTLEHLQQAEKFDDITQVYENALV